MSNSAILGEPDGNGVRPYVFPGNVTVNGTLTADNIGIDNISAPTVSISATAGAVTITGTAGTTVDGNLDVTGDLTADNIVIDNISAPTVSIEATAGDVTITGTGSVVLGDPATGLAVSAGHPGDVSFYLHNNDLANLRITADANNVYLQPAVIDGGEPSQTEYKLVVAPYDTTTEDFAIARNAGVVTATVGGNLNVTGDLTADNIAIDNISAPTVSISATAGALTLAGTSGITCSNPVTGAVLVPVGESETTGVSTIGSEMSGGIYQIELSEAGSTTLPGIPGFTITLMVMSPMPPGVFFQVDCTTSGALANIMVGSMTLNGVRTQVNGGNRVDFNPTAIAGDWVRLTCITDPSGAPPSIYWAIEANAQAADALTVSTA